MLKSLLFILLILSVSENQAQFISGHDSESRNMGLVAMHDLQGRPAYQPTIHHHGDRWIAYVGMHTGSELNPLTGKIEGNGTLLIDVSNPAQPQTLSHIPGDRLDPGKDSEAQMVRVCDIAGGTYLLRDAAIRSRYEVWDVNDPESPEFVTTVIDDISSTHKHWWECDSGIAYLPGQDSKWRKRNTKIFDLSNPEAPRFIRDFGLDGQQPGATADPVPAFIHGPVSYQEKVYFAYGSSNTGTIQIVDREKLLNGDPEPTKENLISPQIGRLDLPRYWGGHTAFPVLDIPVKEFEKDTFLETMDILVVTSEVVRDDCNGPRHPLFLLDITQPDRPFPISSYLVPEKMGNFCDRGGRFGLHAVNESFASIYYKSVIFLSYFNAGIRAVDIRDPFNPVEIGFYIPATTEKTVPMCRTLQEKQICKTVIQTNNVEIDNRGYIYAVDRAGTGMHILTLMPDSLEQ